MDFAAFRPDLEKALAYADGSKGGRPPFDPILMFKILVICPASGPMGQKWRIEKKEDSWLIVTTKE